MSIRHLEGVGWPEGIIACAAVSSGGPAAAFMEDPLRALRGCSSRDRLTWHVRRDRWRAERVVSHGARRFGSVRRALYHFWHAS